MIQVNKYQKSNNLMTLHFHLNQKNFVVSSFVNMKYKGGVIFGIAFAMISFTVGYHVTREKTTECPDYWVRIGTGCYLFAIPEILLLDESCKLDGKVESREIRKISSLYNFHGTKYCYKYKLDVVIIIGQL